MAYQRNRRPAVIRKPLFIISGCLAGANCNYKGLPSSNTSFNKLAANGMAIGLCPEVLGGLDIPRDTAEIKSGNGRDVINGKARVITRKGRDVTANYISGARAVLIAAQQLGIKRAILKENSPACGSSFIYDGTFGGKIKRGAGVLTALLREAGLTVYSETCYRAKSLAQRSSL